MVNPLILLSLFNVAAFLNLVVQKGWESTLGFVVTLGFSAFIVWLNPQRKQEVKMVEFEKVREQCTNLQEQLNALRIKIGFQRAG